MNSAQYYQQANQAIQEKTEKERRILTEHARAVLRAWSELQHHLRLDTGIDDLVVTPYIPQEGILIPLPGTMVRLRFPALEELAGHRIEVLASIIITVSRKTGEVLFARIRQYYKDGTYSIIPCVALDEAIVSAVERAEIEVPAPEEEAV